MRIGIELRQITPGECGGIVPLLQGVLEAVFANYPSCQCELFCIPANASLFPRLPAHVRLEVLDEEGYFPRLDQLAAERQIEVLFRSYPWDAPLGYPPERQLWLLPDLQHDFFPELFDPKILQKRREIFNKVLAEAGAIATLSEYARQTIRAHPATRCQDVFLMGPALVANDSDPAALTDEDRAQVPQGDYFLYPANLWPHKNHRRTLQAFELFLQQSGRPFELVLTGHPDGWDTLAAEFPNLPVRHLGYVRRPLLNELMRRARALVFFSLFEGFGMPLLEAFAAGTPVVCSNSTSLPEVGGDAVLACDPTDIPAMSSALARVVHDEPLRLELVARGRKRLGLFRWQDSAANLVAACQRVADGAARGGIAGQAVGQLHQLLQRREAELEARLDVIHRLDAQFKEDRAAHLDAIARLDRECGLRLEAIHRVTAQLEEANADRMAQRAQIQDLSNQLQSIRALSRRLVRRLVGKAWRTAQSATRLGRSKRSAA
jgi:glycosyltransferase involved in cell wall biosynthesis